MAGDRPAFIMHEPKNKHHDEREEPSEATERCALNRLLRLLPLLCRRDGQTRVTVAVVQPKGVAALQVSWNESRCRPKDLLQPLPPALPPSTPFCASWPPAVRPALSNATSRGDGSHAPERLLEGRTHTQTAAAAAAAAVGSRARGQMLR